jgi:hypothetical protein
MTKLGDTFMNLNQKNPTCSGKNYSSQREKYQDSNTYLKNNCYGFLLSYLCESILGPCPRDIAE